MKRKIKLLQIVFIVFLSSCGERGNQAQEKLEVSPSQSKFEIEAPFRLTLMQANNLAGLPLACLQTEFPNKLGQTIGSKKDLHEPSKLHPAFYGCFDWHSAVHGHWSLVKLLKEFPQLQHNELARAKLQENISLKNIQEEVKYFQATLNKSYERTYGWAWLLKLAEELHTWEDPMARELENNLQPLVDLIVAKYIDFLPRLIYPIRVGEHTNTAFGLSFAWDYANAVHNEELKKSIESRARYFYSGDQGCPLDWEPGGYDFLSPCFEEIDLMRRVLSTTEFHDWMSLFVPQIKHPDFEIAVGEVSDRSDGKLVHLDGLNFSRAWVMYGLARQYPEYKHLINTANKHVKYSLVNLVGDSYEGGHWLGSFAIYALDN